LGCSQQFSKLGFHTSLVLKRKKGKKKEFSVFQKQNKKCHSISDCKMDF
jgi:hypothetical protein